MAGSGPGRGSSGAGEGGICRRLARSARAGLLTIPVARWSCPPRSHFGRGSQGGVFRHRRLRQIDAPSRDDGPDDELVERRRSGAPQGALEANRGKEGPRAPARLSRPSSTLLRLPMVMSGFLGLWRGKTSARAALVPRGARHDPRHRGRGLGSGDDAGPFSRRVRTGMRRSDISVLEGAESPRTRAVRLPGRGGARCREDRGSGRCGAISAG